MLLLRLSLQNLFFTNCLLLHSFYAEDHCPDDCASHSANKLHRMHHQSGITLGLEFLGCMPMASTFENRQNTSLVISRFNSAGYHQPMQYQFVHT